MALSILGVLGGSAVKVTALIAIAAIVCLTARRAPASFRHLVWAIGLVCALLTPIFSVALPSWSTDALVAPPPMGTPDHPDVIQALTSGYTRPVRSQAGRFALPAANKPSAARSQAAGITSTSPVTLVPSFCRAFPWGAFILSIWLIGAATVIARVIMGMVVVCNLAKVSDQPTSNAFAEAVSRSLQVMSPRHPVTFLRAAKSDCLRVPITWTLLKPVIVLPSSSADWPNDRLTATLLHELAHVRRSDWALQVTGRIACAFYWFHPLVWIAARELRRESEAACDDLVLRTGYPATDYARHLLDVALAARNGRRTGSEVMAMAGEPPVEGRIRHILASGLDRRSITQATILACVGTAFCVSMALATMRPKSSPKPDVVAEMDLGNSLESVGLIHGAIDHFRSAVQIEPDNADAQYALGAALLDSNTQPERAFHSHYEPSKQLQDEGLHHLQNAVNLKPSSAKNRLELGGALKQLGRDNEALAQMKIVESELNSPASTPESDVGPNARGFLGWMNHQQMGDTLLAMKDYRGAITEYRAALRFRAYDYEVSMHLGEALNDIGQRNEARALWLKASQPMVGDTSMYNSTSLVHEWAKARGLLEKYPSKKGLRD